ncbi:MAG: prepilin-type N-terminal cleavage/methylation domain-containing protein [Verrucomicrobiota bacterium]
MRHRIKPAPAVGDFTFRRKIVGRSRGFTLLEIMVALALFALVAAAIYSSWFAVMRGAQVGLASAAKVQRSRVAMQTIEEALNSARSFDAGNQYYTFFGENGPEATLSFVSRLSDSFPRSGKFGDFNVRRVTFALEPGPDNGKQLVLRQNPILMELDQDEKAHPVVIAREVKSFGLEFWDGKSDDWLDEWTQTNRLPMMVKVVLQFKGDDIVQAPRENIKVVALPARAVPTAWQRPGAGPGGGPRGPGLTPPISLPGGGK